MREINSNIPGGFAWCNRAFFEPLKVCFETAKEAKRGVKSPSCPRCGVETPVVPDHAVSVDMPGLPEAVLGEGRNDLREIPPIPLKKWFCAIWLIANCKGRRVFLLQRSRARLEGYSADRLVHGSSNPVCHAQREHQQDSCGEVEADETHIGGKARFHAQGSARQDAQSGAISAKLLSLDCWNARLGRLELPWSQTEAKRFCNTRSISMFAAVRT